MSRLNTLRLAVAAVLVSSLMGAALFASQRSAAAMAKAAGQFLDSLTPDQRTRAAFAFNSDDRLRWHFIPNEMFPRKGLMLKDMTAEQRLLAEALLKTGLSSSGFVKVKTIIELEDTLKVMEAGGRFARNKEEYLFSVFGTPDVAAARMQVATGAGLDKVRFAWAGPTEKGQKHYYRIQGPTFLIEFDNTQNNGNHVHSVWRDFNGDFGRDFLREHLAAVAH